MTCLFYPIFAIILLHTSLADEKEKTLKDFDKGPFGFKPPNGRNIDFPFMIHF